MKKFAILCIVLLGVSFAHASYYLTVNGQNVESIELTLGVPVTVGVWSTDTSVVPDPTATTAYGMYGGMTVVTPDSGWLYGDDWGNVANPVINANMGSGAITFANNDPYSNIGHIGWNYANPVPAAAGLWAEWTYTPVAAGEGKIELLTWGPDFTKCVGRSEADFDNNCVVEIDDLLAMVDCWLDSSSCDPNVDLYASSSIDFSDFSLFAGDWLKAAFPNGVTWDIISVTNTVPSGPSIEDNLVLYLPYDEGAGVITNDLSGMAIMESFSARMPSEASMIRSNGLSRFLMTITGSAVSGARRSSFTVVHSRTPHGWAPSRRKLSIRIF